MRDFLAGLAAAILAATVSGIAVAQDQNESTYEYLDLFGTVFESVRAGYVDQVEEVELIKSAIHGMFSSLDPHSAWLEPVGYEALQERSEGAFGGLGIEITQVDGWITVVSPIDDTPAAAAGLDSGDIITHVDGEPFFGLPLQDSVDRLRGEVGTSVTLTIGREGSEPFDVEIKRARIKITAVRNRLIRDVGYIRISTFSSEVGTDLANAVEELAAEANGMPIRGYVLDLRNNPGGLLDQAVAVSDAFLERGEVVSIRGRNPNNIQRFAAKEGDIANGLPLVALINSGSASASEIVAGALRDHRRAVIVGTRSFGKGSVQTVNPLGERGALRLTVSRYYTPSGESIQGFGVEPDIHLPFVPPPEEESDAEEAGNRQGYIESNLPGTLQGEVSEEERDALDEQAAERAREAERLRRRDNQLAFALDLIQGISLGRQ